MYLDADFTYSYADGWGDGFNAKQHTARYHNRSLIQQHDYDRVTRAYIRGGLSRYVISPAFFSGFAARFADSLSDKLDGVPVGLSYGTVGRYLGGDYHPERDLDRTMSLEAVRNALSNIGGRGYALMSEGGNGYVLPYTGSLVNVPLSSSDFDLEEETIPFYQMVVHGVVEYAGKPLNLATDSRTYFLRSLEYGASPYLVMITGDDGLLSGTDLGGNLYSLNAGERLEAAAGWYGEAEPYLTAVRGAQMIGHERLAADVYRTVYDNGVRIVVNYRDAAVTADGAEIEGMGFHVWVGKEG